MHPVDCKASAPAAQTLAPDTTPDLFCPHCDYNLTGLSGERCPECGQTFDRMALIRWAAQPDAPLTLGPDGTTKSHLSGVAIPSLFAPQRLARRLPPLASRGEAATYSAITRGMACLLLVLPWFAPGVEQVGEVLAALWLVALLTGFGLTCEVAVAHLLAWTVNPRSVPAREAHRFWRAMCYCFSTHLCVTPTLVILAMLPAPGSSSPMRRMAITVIAVAVGLWWWLNLGEAIYARGLRSSGRIAAILLIPLVALATIALAYPLFWLLAMVYIY